ncbi:MAG: glycosyltransferase [Acidobacteria bacterium]|nr:glycosyltransferase [Acidobacteriota bacterium]
MVLVHFGNPRATLRCLASLREVETHTPLQIVVDNGSDPDLQEALRDAGLDALVIKAPANGGFAAGYNHGAAEAWREGAGSIWFLNNDAVLKVPLLDRFLAMSSERPDILLWGTHQTESGRRLGTDSQADWLAWYGFQKRLFRGKFREFPHAWRAIHDALTSRPALGRSPRY